MISVSPFETIYFKSEITLNGQCLLNTPVETLKEVNDLKNMKQTGQIWTADDQCKMSLGPSASFCRVNFQTDYFYQTA